MPVDIMSKFEGQRMGISFLGLRNFSIGRDLEKSISLLQSEIDRIHVGVKRRVVERLEYLKNERELHLSMIVEIPINTKKLILDGEKVEIQEQVYYYPRHIDAILKIEEGYLAIFGQNQKEIKEFMKYLRELTVFRLNPIYVRFNNRSMRDLLKSFETVQHLKVVMGSADPVKFIRCSGDSVLDYPLITGILSSEENRVVEIGGIFFSSNDYKTIIHLNDRGRLQIYTDPGKIHTENVHGIMKRVERMVLESDVYSEIGKETQKNVE
jgi:hypothetical protein